MGWLGDFFIILQQNYINKFVAVKKQINYNNISLKKIKNFCLRSIKK